MIEMKKSDLTQEYELALQLFMDGFLEAHPRETLPAWFRTSTTYGGHKEGEDIWRFSFTCIPSSILGPGESWEEKNDGYVLVKTDPDTKERRYVISNVENETIVIFEAIVDIRSRNVSVISNMDLDSIDGRGLLPLRK